jgi:Tfp pilus assembly protein PilF
MRLLRTGLRIVAVVLVALASGVSVNQVLNGGQWNLWWLAAAAMLGMLAESCDLWLGIHDRDRGLGDAAQPVLWRRLAGDDETPMLLSEVTLADLGVHPSRFGGDCPYIRRQADDLLAGSLTGDGKRLVIVEGPRLAGATSTLARATQVCLPDHLAAGFVDDPRVSLADMIAQAGQWAAAAQPRAAGAVLWLDGLSPGRFGELARVPLDALPSGVWVLATVDTGELEGLRVPEQLNTLVDRHAVRVRLGAITAQERRDLLAETAYAALRPVLEQDEDLFLGRLMVAWEPVRDALTRDGSEPGTDRVALLHAVTDWYRARLPRLLSHDILRYLYRAYHHELTGIAPDSPVSASGFTDALQWATAAPSADRPRLIDLQDVSGGQRYAPYPLLGVIADAPGEDVSWPVSDVLWSYTDRYFRGDQRRDIGYSALARNAHHAAARLLSHTDTTIDSEAYGQLAGLFYRQAEWAASRHWWQQTVSTGHPDRAPEAMFNLGILEYEQGDPGQARHWYQQAIGTGHPDHAPKTMVNLGVMEYEQGDPGQARHWYQQAIGTGHPDYTPAAMSNLGVIEKEQGDSGQARHWWQQAVSTGHPDQAPKAMFNLGVMEYEQGHPGQARHWYQQTVSTGHPDQAPKAMFNLGVMEYEQGHPGRARHWYQQVISTGHPGATSRAQHALLALDQHEKERQRGEQSGR